MFIGHFAVALGAKKTTPKVSLGTMFMASQFIDLLWPLFLLLGLERAEVNTAHPATPIDFTYYPYSHSLLFVCIWAMAFAGIHFLFKRDKRNALVLGSLVLSHWFLDLIVHRPDLPLMMNGPYLGMGLWNTYWMGFILETILFLTAVVLYFRTTKVLNKRGKWGSVFLMASLAFIHLGNMFGPPPPSITIVAYAGNLTWIFVVLGYWVDRNRKSIS